MGVPPQETTTSITPTLFNGKPQLAVLSPFTGKPKATVLSSFTGKPKATVLSSFTGKPKAIVLSPFTGMDVGGWPLDARLATRTSPWKSGTNSTSGIDCPQKMCPFEVETLPVENGSWYIQSVQWCLTYWFAGQTSRK